MVEAVVEYDYSAQEADELTIRKGDVIRDIVKKPGGWWEGTLREKRGMFPDNFVTVIVKQRSKPGRAHVVRQCRALFSYHPAHDDELSLGVGDIIEVLGEVEEGWWRGRIGDQEGVFPSNFVAEIDSNKAKHTGSKEDLTASSENDTASPNLPPKPSKIICQVKYGYEACNDDELTLKEGDLITLISKDGQDPGWWRGELHGKVGVFPDNFVTVIPAAEVNGPSTHHLGASQPIAIPNSIKSVSRSPTTVQSELKGNNAVSNSASGNVAAHRKSLDLKTVSSSPPIPGKKPSVPKKSPSTSAAQGSTGTSPSLSSGGSVMAGLRKLVDLVDGAASSRLKLHDDKEKEKETFTEIKDNEFDHVERSSLLSDMRQNRAKRPQGRRPPSQLYPKEGDMVNGDASITDIHLPEDHQMTTNDSDSYITAASADDEPIAEEIKPKVREWEKNKAPWMAELRQNQAKRTSIGTPQTTNMTKTPEKPDIVPAPEEPPPHKKIDISETSPIDMSKSMSSIITKKPTESNEFVVLRSKTPQPTNITPTRPQSIHATSPGNVGNTDVKTSPLVPKPPVADKSNITTSPRTSVNVVAIDRKLDYVSMSKYNELLDRVTQIETRMNHKLSELQAQVDDLEGRLKVESDLRRHFQVELEKVAQCVTQV